MARADCRWCGLGETRRRNGLCDACNAYQDKYGELPPLRVIERRLRRMLARRTTRV